MNWLDKIAEFRETEQAKQRARDKKHEEIIRSMKEKGRRKNTELMPCLQSATSKDYCQWLEGFINQGGEPTHAHDYPMSQHGCFYIAKRDFLMFPLYGASAIHIIVPRAYTYSGCDLGHCSLYIEDGYQAVGYWIPIFSDTIGGN